MTDWLDGTERLMVKVAVVVPPAEEITAESEIEAWVRIGSATWRIPRCHPLPRS